MQAAEQGFPPASPPQGVAGYFRRRWQKRVPLATLFWQDTLIIGSFVNVVALGIAVAMLAADFSLAPVLAVHFATAPYNVFLTVTVWRQAEDYKGLTAPLYMAGAVLWLVAVTVA